MKQGKAKVMRNNKVSSIYYNTLLPYAEIEYTGISYTYPREYNHISRHKGLRQVIHNADESDRFVAPETMNSIKSEVPVHYYIVPLREENRLDLIAYNQLGSAQYAWVLCYLNGIEDGFTVYEGQRLAIPGSIFDLFNKGELLANEANVFVMQLGEE